MSINLYLFNIEKKKIIQCLYYYMLFCVYETTREVYQYTNTTRRHIIISRKINFSLALSTVEFNDPLKFPL